MLRVQPHAEGFESYPSILVEAVVGRVGFNPSSFLISVKVNHVGSCKPYF